MANGRTLAPLLLMLAWWSVSATNTSLHGMVLLFPDQWR